MHVKEKSTVIFAAILLSITAVLAHVEELDDRFRDARLDEIWLVEFYAPWCEYCQTLDPIWSEVGDELKRLGSPVTVGKIDTTVYTSVATEFGVLRYPTIKVLKGELSYEYRGPRVTDAIIEFTNRVTGPVVRPLLTPQLFQHVKNRHDVFFVYIGGDSPLKEEYISVAKEFIIHTYFFSAAEDILPKTVVLPDVPAVAGFKDGTHFLYDGESPRFYNVCEYG